MRRVPVFAPLSACLLAACGGGGGSGTESASSSPVKVIDVTPTPAPTSTPVPTPTPTPTATPVQIETPASVPASALIPAGSPTGVTPELVLPETVVTPGERVAHVRVTLTEAARRPLAWKCLTRNGTAWSGTYYEMTAATVMFRPGETEHVVDVPIKRDLGAFTVELACTWPQMGPTIPGAVGTIRQGTVRPEFTRAGEPTYPTLQTKSGRSLFFSSDFQEKITPVIEKGTWRSRFGWGRVQTNNKEIAPYTDATTDPGVNPHPIVDGKRVLRAEFLPTKDQGVDYRFSASLLDSANLVTFQYGYIELRAKLSIAQGTVAAFWLLPASGKWPPEVDIGEFNLGDHRNWQSTIHYVDDGKKTGEGITVPDWVEDGQWHVIGFDWTPEWQVTLVDGVEVMRRPNLFNEPMKIVLDVSVGGLGPDPKDPTPGWKSEIALDYLKIWR